MNKEQMIIMDVFNIIKNYKLELKDMTIETMTTGFRKMSFSFYIDTKKEDEKL